MLTIRTKNTRETEPLCGRPYRTEDILRLVLSLLLALSVLIGSGFARATDISSVVRDTAMQPIRGDGGHIEIGLGYEAYLGFIYGYPESNADGLEGNDERFDSDLFINLNTYYQFRGFFVEFYSDFISNGSVGYNFLQTDQWSFDLFLTETHGYLGSDTSELWKTLEDRDDDFAVGLRSSYYHPQFTLQFSLLRDALDTHNGNAATLFLGRNLQYRNWNFHGLIGFEYSSKEINDYYFGISQQESLDNPQFPPYTSGAGFDLLAEIGATYPLSETWVFKTSYRVQRFAKRVADSPLITHPITQQLSTSISYVF